MDAEKLRSTYNQYFSVDKNIWSSTDQKKTLKVASKTLQWLKKLRNQNTALSLLDVGCATGFYTEAFRLLGANTIGLDYSEVAIDQAKKKFPACRFVQMNGFDPHFNETFDVIFCRGFSGANTHDLEFIALWMNKYMKYLKPDGFFVFAYSSNFSGVETEGEIVNHSEKELKTLVSKINGKYRGTFLFYYFGLISQLKRAIQKTLDKKVKDYFYIYIQKN